MVWSPASAEPPSGLLVALGAKGLGVERADTAYAALAGVLGRSSSSEVVVLVIVDPEDQPRYEEAMATLDRYAPRAARWTYDAAAEPPLQIARPRPIARNDQSDQSDHTPASALAEPKPTPTAHHHQSGPMLRLTGLGVLGGVGHTKPPERGQSDLDLPRADGPDELLDEQAATHHASPESILTSEEMAALLSDDGAEFTHEGDRS